MDGFFILESMLSDTLNGARLWDYLIAIVGSGAFALLYLLALRAPGRNRVTRLINRLATFSGRLPLGASPRVAIVAVVVVCSIICFAAIVSLLIRLAGGGF